MQHDTQSYQPIENYGIIGDLQTVALVSIDASIDFMSFPRFDSPTTFASMLDKDKGGCFRIEPQIGEFTTKQLYLPGTAVLITRFFSKTGIAEITDYMPLDTDNKAGSSTIVRKITAVRGDINFKMHCAPRFHYAEKTHEAILCGNDILFLENEGVTHLRILAEVPLEIVDGNGYAEFSVSESSIVHIVLECSLAGRQTTSQTIEHYTANTYQQTINDWRKWVNKSTYRGLGMEFISRSAITLKLLTSRYYGAPVAAATFGLPEVVGGNRNWDYRFTWIRDAAFTMYAFLRLGYYEEATDFLSWILHVSKGKKLQLLYSVDGREDLQEKELNHLQGYKNSQPVRIGNAAKDQLQLDIYGELIDTIYIYNKSYKPVTHELWEVICDFVDEVIQNWHLPDHGIWEIRNEKKEFLHSRLMCWVAMDRAIKIAESRTFPYPEEQWKAVRNDIYNDIFHNFWNEEMKAWVQYKGARQVDASALLMPLVHFVSPIEPRWLSTMEVIDQKLRLDVLIYRYQNAHEKIDGLDGEEGTFNMCSFWFIEALAKSGQIDRAIENFEKMRGYANHLGLYSEELGKQGESLGNFPQAFTHLALISAALELEKQISRVR